MSLIQKDAIRTMLISYFGLGLGYINKGILFIVFLTSAQIGLLNLVTSVGALFAQASSLGTIYTVTKFFPFFQNKDNNNHGFLLLTTLIVIGGIAIFSLLTFIFQNNISSLYNDRSKEFVEYYYWIIPIGIGNVMFLLFENYLRVQYKNIIGVFANEILVRIGSIVALIFYGLHTISFEIFVILYFIIHFIPASFLFVYLIRNNNFSFNLASISIPKRFKKIMITFSLFNYFNSLGSLFVLSVDSLMITAYIGLDKFGVYSQVIFLTSALMIPYRSLLRVGSTFVPYYWKNKDLKKMKVLYEKISSVSLIMGLLLFAIVWLNITELFSFLPDAYNEGIWVFLFIMIGKLVDMYFGINGTIFITSKKYKYDLIFTLFLILSIIILNIYLIPVYGITGVAISTSLTYIIYNLSRLIFVYKVYRIHPFSKNQFYIILLFLFTIFSGELIFPLTSVVFVNILVQSVYVFIVFCLPIYYYKLEPNSIDYFYNGFEFLKKKIIKN